MAIPCEGTTFSRFERMIYGKGQSVSVDERDVGVGATRRSTLAMLQRTADGFTLPIDNGEEISLRFKDFRKSKCLMTSYEASSDGDVVPLGLTIDMLLAWRGFRIGGGCDPNLPLDVAVLALEVRFSPSMQNHLCFISFEIECCCGTCHTLPLACRARVKQATHKIFHCGNYRMLVGRWQFS